MSDRGLITIVGSLSMVLVAISLILSVITNILFGRKLSSIPDTSYISLFFSVINGMLVGILTYRCARESDINTSEWILFQFRARTLFTIAIPISAGITTGAIVWGIASGQLNLTSEKPLAVVTTAYGVTWATATYLQGLLCAISLVLSNIRDNQCHWYHSYTMSLTMPGLGMSSPSSMEHGTLSPSLWALSGYLDEFRQNERQRRWRLQTKRNQPYRRYDYYPTGRQHSFIQWCSAKLRWKDGRNTSRQACTQSYMLPRLNFEIGKSLRSRPGSLCELIESDIHPLFRPSSPQLSPTPTSSTSILAAPAKVLPNPKHVINTHILLPKGGHSRDL